MKIYDNNKCRKFNEVINSQIWRKYSEPISVYSYVALKIPSQLLLVN